LQQGDRELLQTARDVGYQGERLHMLERTLSEYGALRLRYLPNALPSLLFIWVALLVVAGRKVAAQIARRLRWPDLSHGRLSDLRLPDGAVWFLIAGLGLVLAGPHSRLPSAWTLLIVPALG